MVVLGIDVAKTWFAENIDGREFLVKTWSTSPPQERVLLPLLSKGMVKLPFLQTFKSISPGWGWHAPIGVQKNPEAPDNEDVQENKQQNHKNKCGLLLQRHARIWQRVPKGHQGEEETGCPPSVVRGNQSKGSPRFFFFHHQSAEIMALASWRGKVICGKKERGKREITNKEQLYFLAHSHVFQREEGISKLVR